MNRRRLLEMSGLAAALGLAGCMADGGEGTPTAGDTTTADGTTTGDGTTGDTTTAGEEGYAHVDGQTFRMPMGEDPSAFYWFYYDVGDTSFDDAFDVNIVEAPGLVTHEYGVWFDDHALGAESLNYRTYEDVITEDDRIEITVADDAYWSDGEPMTSRDAIASVINARLAGPAQSLEALQEQGPANTRDAVTGFELPDDKTAVLLSEGGHFGDLTKVRIWADLLIWRGPKFPTHIEPYEQYVDRLFEVMNRAGAGEIDPWNDSDQPLRTDLQREVYGERGLEYWFEHFQNPDNVVTNGAWQFDEVLQSELVLTPNEHHRYADRINFDELILEQMGDPNRIWTALNVERLDFADVAPPSHIIDEFPDAYERPQVPQSFGTSFLLNHNWPGLHKVMGRQGIQHAIDTEAIVEVVNPNLYQSIQVPGGDALYVDEYLSADWIEENLIDYSYDPERGAEKMREAGFSKPNDQWLDENGDPIQLVVHAESGGDEALPMETNLAAQLRDFGVSAEVRPLESTQFENALRNNEICLYTGPYAAGVVTWVARSMRGSWLFEDEAYGHRWFPKEQIDQHEYENGLAANEDPENLRHMTTMAPPVGQPDGELQEYETMYLTRKLFTETDEERRTEMMQELLWIINWYVPAWSVANEFRLAFLNTANWIWEARNDEEMWNRLGTGWLTFQDMLSWGDQVFANPDNPKSQ